MYSGAITDVEGILVGHCTDQEAKTGVTAILAQGGAVAGVQVLGGGPGTRETDSMHSPPAHTRPPPPRCRHRLRLRGAWVPGWIRR